jgi:predicted nucleic acid-binding protein
VKYVDASALLRVLFSEPGLEVPLRGDDRIVSSELLEIEAFRAVDRERLLGQLTDQETAAKRKELSELISKIDLAPMDRAVVDKAKASFAINVRALDAIHVATAEVLRDEAEGETIEFWTHDDRQASAAMSRGLNVFGIAEAEDNREYRPKEPLDNPES